ncbi:hypothetical protein V8B97DRAFT_2023733 [Scleroderma yunnanense]
MPPPMKKQTKYFHSGLIEDLQNIAMDPTYLDNSGDDSKNDFNSSTIEDMSLGLFTDKLTDETVSESSEESDSDIIYIAMAKKHSNNPEKALEEFKAEDAPDDMEKCAHRAIVTAHQFWTGVMSTCHKSTKPIKAAMLTYIGAVLTSNYL